MNKILMAAFEFRIFKIMATSMGETGVDSLTAYERLSVDVTPVAAHESVGVRLDMLWKKDEAHQGVIDLESKPGDGLKLSSGCHLSTR